MDRLRGAAILAVLVLHAELVASAATGRALPVVHTFNQLLGPVRMPLLVALSGLLLAPALAKPWRQFLDGKVRRLLWPYLVWSAIDLAMLQARLLAEGESLHWSWVVRVLYDPVTYLWFLAHLFVYYAAAVVMPAPVRSVAGPGLLAAAYVLEGTLGPDLHRLLWLWGWFLLGDVVGRAVAHRLVRRVAAGPDPLGFVGRRSLVYYASHLVVALAVTDVLRWLGVSHVWVVFLASVLVPLVVGTLLARDRRLDLLFTCPPLLARPPLRSSGDPADHRSLRPAR